LNYRDFTSICQSNKFTKVSGHNLSQTEAILKDKLYDDYQYVEMQWSMWVLRYNKNIKESCIL